MKEEGGRRKCQRNGGMGSFPALRLASYFHTDAEFWMQLQLAWDIHRTRAARKT